MKEFKYLRVSFTSEGKVGHEIDRWVGVASAVVQPVYPTVCGEEGAEPQGKAFDLAVELHSNLHLCSQALSSD